MKTFLATSYTSQIGADGYVLSAYRSQIEELIGVLRDAGQTVFCAPQEDDWKLNDLAPVEAFKLDIEKLNESDLLVAYVKLNPPSVGVQFELGMAYALKKRIILIHHLDDKLPYMNLGLVDADLVTELVYKDSKEVASKLKDVVST